MAKEITSYTFRIHEGSTSGVVTNGWQSSRGLDTNDISSIEDSLDKMPASGKIGTSIPTPLARVYLFKTAFELVTSQTNRKAGVYDELVSDCLDILQLLFEKGGDAAKFEFIPWNASDEIRRLRSANDEISRGNPDYNALRLLADSFELALDSAKEFADCITLIKYDGILLGGTSPYTLVFTSANLRYELSKRRASENGYDFSSNKKQEYCGEKRLPLSARPKEFQMFLKTFVNNASYLELFAHGGPLKTFADYVNAQTTSVQEVSEDFDVLFPEIRGLNVLGLPFRFNDMATIPTESDFMMRPSVNYYKQYMAYEPLMLPSDFSSSGWIYVDDSWDPRTHIPNRVVKRLRADSSFASRCLPKNGSALGEPTTQKYPWVSDEDLLTDHLIDLSYDLNTKFFFNNAQKYPRFLLPIKKDYFMFFTLDDLKRNLKMTVDAKEITNDEGRVVDVKVNKVLVELEIPLKSRKRSLKITREYIAAETADYPIKKAKPGIGLGIFPFYRINEEELDLKNQYSIYLYNSGPSDVVKLSFFNIKKSLVTPITAEEVVRTKEDSGTSKVYNLRALNASNAFDLIEVNIQRPKESGGHNGAFNEDFDTGIVIPEWGKGRLIGKESLGSDQKKTIFSIDFGTSNTHVAYWDPNENMVKPLEISHDDLQMVLLNKPYEKDNVIDYRESSSFGSNLRFTEYLREFMPSIIGHKQKVSYPIKTATLEGLDFERGKNLFGNINIGYDIENEQVDLSNASSVTYTTNLKWALQEDRNDGRKKNRVEAFCEQTLWILKNLLVLKGFSPRDISIIYFYPESMMQDDKEMFKNAWNTAADIVFKQCGFSIKDNQCLSELESVAPYYSLLKRDRSLYAYNSVNIDIGGGTTDFLIFDKGCSSAYESSVLFAGNDIWGKAYPEGEGGKNGFVELMRSMIPSSIISEESKTAYRFFNKKDDPAEMTSFFFKYEDFDYGGKIASNPKLRFVLFLHYAAIIFYLCDMIKQVRRQQNPDFKLPKSLTFTGKGSEYIKIITPDPEMISRITFALFVAYGFKPEEFEKGFHITYPSNPKGLTAEGGVYKLISDPAILVNFVKKEDSALSYMNGEEFIDRRDKIQYENLGDYLIGFDRVPDEKFVVDGVKEYKGRVMSHFREMIDSIFDSDLLARLLKSLGMNLESDDKRRTLELAEESYDQHAERFSKVHTIRTAPIEGTLFFLAMKNLLIDLSLWYFERSNNKRN